MLKLRRSSVFNRRVVCLRDEQQGEDGERGRGGEEGMVARKKEGQACGDGPSRGEDGGDLDRAGRGRGLA